MGTYDGKDAYGRPTGTSGAGVYDAQGNEIQRNGKNDTPSGFTVDPTTYAQSFSQLNPYSAQAGSNIFGSNANNFINSAMAAGPNAGFETFMSQQANPLAELVSGQMSPLQASLTERAQTLSNQAVDSVAGQFAGNNALYSSAFGEKAMTAGAQPFADVANALGQQQIGLTGNLWNNQLGLAQQGYANQLQTAMNMLGLQGSFGDQMFVNPNQATVQSSASQFWQNVLPFAQLGLSAATAGAGGGK